MRSILTISHDGNLGVESSNPPPPLTCSSQRLTHDAPSLGSTRSQLVETGIIPTYSQHCFLLCFETEPFWLLALEPSFTASIFIDNVLSSFSDLHFYLTQYSRLSDFNKTATRLGRHKFIFNFDNSSLPATTQLS